MSRAAAKRDTVTTFNDEANTVAIHTPFIAESYRWRRPTASLRTEGHRFESCRARFGCDGI
jgi:hypothetical protein